jgi:hypothetical protein
MVGRTAARLPHEQPPRRLRLVVDADALAGGPGRAIDAAVKVGFDISDTWRLTLGYRTLEVERM